MTLGFGYAANEGGGVHGQILTWSAGGHASTAEHTELTAKCRYVNEGGQQTAGVWMTAEPRPRFVEQEGVVCVNKAKRALEECTGPNETEEDRHLVREVTRDNLSLPWSGRFVEGEVGEGFAQLGESLEAGRTCQEAEHLPTSEHGPLGCIRVQLLAPELGLDLPMEGGLDPKAVNGIRNGLSPSLWEFQGEHENGSESFSYAKNRAIHFFLSGKTKVLGSEGEELLTVE